MSIYSGMDTITEAPLRTQTVASYRLGQKLVLEIKNFKIRLKVNFIHYFSTTACDNRFKQNHIFLIKIKIFHSD